MRPLETVRETMVTARTQPVPTVLIALLVAAMCCSTLLTVGRTASAEQQINARLEAAGSRVLVVRDTRAAGLLSAPVVSSISALSTVERSLALAAPTDVANGAVADAGVRVPAWAALGDMAAGVRLVTGRWPRAGEAVVAEQALARIGLDGPAGHVSGAGGAYNVVGVYAARPPFEHLDAGALTPAPPTVGAATIEVLAADAAAVGALQQQVLRLVAARGDDGLEVDSPTGLAQLQEQISGDVGAVNRSLVLLVLFTGAVLTGVVVVADTLLRRSDIGRRRALGAGRPLIVTLVLGRAALAACCGAAVGVVAGTGVALRVGAAAPVDFIAATAVLAVVTATVAALPPALAAAYRDPVRVLRTP